MKLKKELDQGTKNQKGKETKEQKSFLQGNFFFMGTHAS